MENNNGHEGSWQKCTNFGVVSLYLSTKKRHHGALIKYPFHTPENISKTATLSKNNNIYTMTLSYLLPVFLVLLGSTVVMVESHRRRRRWFPRRRGGHSTRFRSIDATSCLAPLREADGLGSGDAFSNNFVDSSCTSSEEAPGCAYYGGQQRLGIDGVLVCRSKAKGCNGDDEVIYQNKTMCINPAQSLDLNLVRDVMCGCCEEDAAICPVQCGCSCTDGTHTGVLINSTNTRGLETSSRLYCVPPEVAVSKQLAYAKSPRAEVECVPDEMGCNETDFITPSSYFLSPNV